jgi:hypothetical protein
MSERATFSPVEHAKGRQIGTEVHVRLFNADEPLDGRPVEHDLAVERLLELAVGNLDVLDGAEDVGELKAHELHLFALGALEDLRLGLTGVRRCVLGHEPDDFSQLSIADSRLIR